MPLKIVPNPDSDSAEFPTPEISGIHLVLEIPEEDSFDLDFVVDKEKSIGEVDKVPFKDVLDYVFDAYAADYEVADDVVERTIAAKKMDFMFKVKKEWNKRGIYRCLTPEETDSAMAFLDMRISETLKLPRPVEMDDKVKMPMIFDENEVNTTRKQCEDCLNRLVCPKK